MLSSYDPNDHLWITLSTPGAVVVVEVCGEVDIATGDILAESIFAQVDAAPTGVVVDLGKVEFMGSAGLAVLVKAYQRAQDRGVGFGIVVPDDSAVRRTLNISGLDHYLPCHLTARDATHSMTGRGVPY